MQCPTRGRTRSQSRLLSAVDYVQATAPAQGRRGDGARVHTVDILLVPSLRDEMLTITNATGHPSLTLRAGFVEVGERAATGPRSRAPDAEVLAPRRVPHA